MRSISRVKRIRRREKDNPDQLENFFIALERQARDKQIAVVASDSPAGMAYPPHSHRQGQLIHAISGVMIVHADAGSWVVPMDQPFAALAQEYLRLRYGHPAPPAEPVRDYSRAVRAFRVRSVVK